jgi:signal transduction histidine kinase/ActR/RegA family two-component response regulator
MARKNTLPLRVALGAAAVAIAAAVVFVALLVAVAAGHDRNHDAARAQHLISAATAARYQVTTTDASDTALVRRAKRAATAAAGAADASPALGTASGDQIRSAAAAYQANPVAAESTLVQTLNSAVSLQEAATPDSSGKLDSSLSVALAIGVAGLVMTLLVLAVFGNDIVRSVAAPIRRLAAGAKRLGSGDLTTRVPETGVEDVKALARSLNSMAISLAATRKTLDSQQAQLSSSRAETNRANTAKNEFLSRMSHELRTPLNAILGFAQLLELDELDSRQRDNVAHIVSGGQHLLNLINEVLEISRIETGSMSPAIEPVNAAEIVREGIELVSPLAAQRKIALSASIDTQADVWIAADRQRLKQILLNLLANAVKYNRDGGSVTVRIKSLAGRGRIEVTDTGQGIPQDQLPKLFVPFERLGAESTGVEGTGLGLVLALRLAEAMDGTLGVESQPWIGSTFHIELPLATAPEAREPELLPSRLTAATQAPPVFDHGTRRVLYIEDDTANTHLMAQLFAEEPRLDLMTTMYGKLGVELARQHLPDLILLDAHLPDLSGDEVMKRLRADDSTRSIPVITVSADATEESRARMTALGASKYLTKPLTLNVVLTAVWEVLDDAEAKVA